MVGIDEGQFFDAELPAVASELARRGVRVIVAGLDQDYLGKPFEPMPQLLAIAEYITKTRAICMVCGNPANHTQRLVNSSDRVLLGAQGTYEARCRHCFDPDAVARGRDPGHPSRRREGAMSLQELAPALRQALLALGVLFVIVDVKVGAQILGWWRKRPRAIVTWPGPKPPFYAINLLIGVMLGILLFVHHASLVPRPASSVFGVAMMFIYYGYLLPLSTRIRRGLYQDGIWTDSGFMRIHRHRRPHLEGRRHAGAGVPAQDAGATAPRAGLHLGEVRHFLREKIGDHAIEFEAGPGLHLGTRDTRESV